MSHSNPAEHHSSVMLLPLQYFSISERKRAMNQTAASHVRVGHHSSEVMVLLTWQ